MNDVVPFFWDGEYHIFYLYKKPEKYWRHIKSTDLIHWEDLPIALAPGEEGPDKDGCWTGCCIRAYGKFHIFYTGVNYDTGFNTVCHAVSDDLINWKKDPRNPLARASYPYKEGNNAFRDPCIWKMNEWWYMVLIANLVGKPKRLGGCVALLRSKKLKEWEVLDPIYVSDGMCACECPDIFSLDEKNVLLMSGGHTFVRISDSIDGPFKMSSGNSFFDGSKCYAV